jgi:structure-specific recognition protein 1
MHAYIHSLNVGFEFQVQLDPPIRQGQTRYPFLVMQFAKDEEIDAELNLDESVTSASLPNV